MRVEPPALWAEGRARLRFRPGAAGIGLGALFATTNEVVSSTNRLVDIAADAYELDALQAVFCGHVRLTDSQEQQTRGTLCCEQLTVQFVPGTNQVKTITAEKNVVYEQGSIGVTNGPATHQQLACDVLTVAAEQGRLAAMDAAGQVEYIQGAMRAKGERMAYRVATEQVELTGNPVVTLPQGKLTGPVIVLDRRQGKVMVPNFQFESVPGSLRGFPPPLPAR